MLLSISNFKSTASAVPRIFICVRQTCAMMKTVMNEVYQGELVKMSIPAEVFQRADGRACARVGTAVPIHCCSPEEVAERAKATHHYVDIFTEDTLTPLGEVAYVRIDDTTAEKVHINYSLSILLHSSDGVLAQWRCAPTFRSANAYVAGAPLVGADGALVSLVTARRGEDYAVANIRGVGGYFDTRSPWKVVTSASGLIYADRALASREALRHYVFSLPAGVDSHEGSTQQFSPIVHDCPSPRIALVAPTGRQVAHTILDHVIVHGIEYL